MDDKLLLALTAAAARSRVKTVFVRPVTASHFVQANVSDFVPIAQKFGIALVLAEMEAMGRDEADFAEWRATKTRARAIERGAAFVVLSVTTHSPAGGNVSQGRLATIATSISAAARSARVRATDATTR